MTLALIIVASILGYGFGAGVNYAIAAPRMDDTYDAALLSLFWPVILPAMLGAALVRRLTAPRLPAARVHKELP